MNRESSEEINGCVEKMIGLANDILHVANNSGNDEDRKNIQRVLAGIVTDLDIDILEPIYKKFPDLRPPEMEELRFGNEK